MRDRNEFDIRADLAADEECRDGIRERLEGLDDESAEIRRDIDLLSESLSASVAGDYERAERLGQMLDERLDEHEGGG